MDITKKRWDANIQCWVLDTSAVPSSEKKWDAVTKEWKKDEEFFASSCEIPPEYWKKSKEGQSKTTQTWNNHGVYKPLYPWEGIDRKKWRSAWLAMVLMYHDYSWHQGKWISDEDYRNRMKGIYTPEPKYRYGNINHGYHGPYNEGCD